MEQETSTHMNNNKKITAIYKTTTKASENEDELILNVCGWEE